MGNVIAQWIAVHCIAGLGVWRLPTWSEQSAHPPDTDRNVGSEKPYHLQSEKQLCLQRARLPLRQHRVQITNRDADEERGQQCQRCCAKRGGSRSSVAKPGI